MAKTILVTGAAGFIGSHAVEQLVKRGDHVIGLDNLNDYYDPSRKKANLQSMLHTGINETLRTLLHLVLTLIFFIRPAHLRISNLSKMFLIN